MTWVKANVEDYFSTYEFGYCIVVEDPEGSENLNRLITPVGFGLHGL